MRIIIILFLILNSCKETKTLNDYYCINDYLKNFNLDRAYLYNKITPLEETLDIYKSGVVQFKKKHINDSLNVFSEKELKELQLKKYNKTEWAEGELNNLKVITNDALQNLYNHITKNNGFLLTISQPVFNKNKTKAMFTVSKTTHINVVETKVVMYKKNSDKWLYVGEIYDYKIP